MPVLYRRSDCSNLARNASYAANPDRASPHRTPMHRTAEQLAAGLASIAAPPRDHGTLEMIVCRPGLGLRTVLDEGVLALAVGLEGDSWNARPSRHMPDNSPSPERQLTLMCSRVIAVIAGDRDRWPLAGDQLFVDLDLSSSNLPAGTQLQIGEAVIAITAAPHTGCAKFTERFGSDASRWVNAPQGRIGNLRGVNARVVAPGRVRRGDSVRKVM